jgi:ribonucleoside-diphosphate reductase alpha chain
MNKDFALWLGIVASKGRYYETNGYVGVSLNDKIIAKIFHELSIKVFKIKPVVYEDKNGYIQHYINSRNLVRFLKQTLGVNSNMKKVPQQLLEGSVDEQLAFMRGLTLDGYIEQGCLVVYGGISKRLADFCAIVLRNCGHSVYQQMRKSGQGNSVYYTKITGSQKNSLDFWALEEKKTEGIDKGGFLVKVTPEILSSKIASNHPSYSALRNLRQRDAKTCYNYTLEELEIDYPQDEYYVMVKEVSTELSNGFCIETDAEGMIHQGAVLGLK